MQRLFGGRDTGELPPPTYSNEAVLARIEREEGVDRDTTRSWFREKLIFLDLCARFDELLSPPPNVDKAWHAFLLHTRDYEAYCNERFGRLIHHQPTGEPDSAAYRRSWQARQRYAAGGTADPSLWTVPAGVSSAKDDERRGSSCGGGGGAGPYGSGGGGDSGGGFGCGGGSGCGGGGCGGGGG